LIYTYLGNRVSQEWMPLAMANGLEDARQGYKLGNLYRWTRAPACAALYLVGKILGWVLTNQRNRKKAERVER